MSLLPLSLGQAGSCEQFMSEARKCLLFLTSGKFFKITISTSLMGILAMTLLRPLNNIYWAHGTGQCILQLLNSLNGNNLLSVFPINWKLYFRYIGNWNFGSSLLQLLNNNIDLSISNDSFFEQITNGKSRHEGYFFCICSVSIPMNTNRQRLCKSYQLSHVCVSSLLPPPDCQFV